jgi:hypothetical protein
MSEPTTTEQTHESQTSADVLYSETPATPAPTEPAATVPPAEPATPNAEPAKPTEEAAATDPQKTDDKSKDNVDQTKDKNSKPEKYDLKLPDKSPVEPSRIAEIEAEAKAQGLTQEQAQGLVDREHKVVSNLIETHAKRVEGWLSEATSDKEIGGTEINRNIELAKRVVDTYGSPLFKQYLETSGLGQHPEMLRLFVRIGKASGEDRLVAGSKGIAAKPKSAADLLFGDESNQ